MGKARKAKKKQNLQVVPLTGKIGARVEKCEESPTVPLAVRAPLRRRRPRRSFDLVEDAHWTPSRLRDTYTRTLADRAGASDSDLELYWSIKGEVWAVYQLRHPWEAPIVMEWLDGRSIAVAADEMGISERTGYRYVEEFFEFASDYAATSDSHVYCAETECRSGSKACGMHQARAAIRAGCSVDELDLHARKAGTRPGT